LPALAIAWMLKEALRTWYATSTVETAEQELDAWITQVREHGPDPMRQAYGYRNFQNLRLRILTGDAL
jgi:hypothetical protein